MFMLNFMDEFVSFLTPTNSFGNQMKLPGDDKNIVKSLDVYSNLSTSSDVFHVLLKVLL